MSFIHIFSCIFSLNGRFGTIAVPNMLVFHNTKAIARFNSSSRVLESMVQFLTNVTGNNNLNSLYIYRIEYSLVILQCS